MAIIGYNWRMCISVHKTDSPREKTLNAKIAYANLCVHTGHLPLKCVRMIGQVGPKVRSKPLKVHKLTFG